jgi:hypothetical protein
MKALFLIFVFCLQMVSGVSSASEHSSHAQKHSADQEIMHMTMDCHNDGNISDNENKSKLDDLCKLDCQLSLCAATPAFISSSLHFIPQPQSAATSFYTFNLHPSLQELPFRPPLTV